MHFWGIIYCSNSARCMWRPELLGAIFQHCFRSICSAKEHLCSASVLLEPLAAGHLLCSGNGWAWHSELCSGSEGGGWSKVGFDDLKGLLQLYWFCDSVSCNLLLAALFHSDLLWLGNQSLFAKEHVVPSPVLQLEMVSGLNFSEWNCWYQFNLVHGWFISLGDVPGLFSPGCLFLCCIYRQQHSLLSASKLFFSFPL